MDNLKNYLENENNPTNISIEYLVSELNLQKCENEQEYWCFPKNTLEGKQTANEGNFGLVELKNSFESFDFIESENIIRPITDTTLFTTSGIQRIESLLRDQENIEEINTAVFQPVLRSQYIDNVSEGNTSSFTNFTAMSTSVTTGDFLQSIRQVVDLLPRAQNDNTQNLRLRIEENNAHWGSKEFKNTVVSFLFNSIEIGECVFIKDFPYGKESKLDIIDIGLGIERLRWSLEEPGTPFLVSYSEIYQQLEAKGVSRDDIVGIIDPIRSMTLIALDGAKPSNKNHGYRFRQLSKRMTTRTQGLDIVVDNIIKIAYEEWMEFGHKPTLELEEVTEIVSTENQRNYNRSLLDQLASSKNIKLKININQSTSSFIAQLRYSLNDEDINNLIRNEHYDA